MKIIPFFKKLTGLDPTPAQSRLLHAIADPKIKKILVSAGRQTGKTLTCAVGGLSWVFEYNKPIKILLMSAQESVLYFHMREIFKNNSKLEESIIAKGTYSIIPLKGFETSMGDIVYVRGSTHKQVRGLPADIVIIDEACEIKDEIILTAMGNLSGPISKLIILSTSHVLDSLFVKWACNPKLLGFEFFTWSAEDCPWHSKEWLATKKKAMSKAMYAVEVLGRPPTKSERSFFPHKHIKACVVEQLTPEGGIREAGLDFGEVVGKNLLTITEKNGIRRKVLFQKWYRKPLEECIDDIQSVLEKYKVVIIKADSKPTEYQKVVGKKLGSIPVHYVDARFNKDNMLGQLKRHIQRHTIEIDKGQVRLVMELKKYRKGKRSGDDRVDSLALSCYITPHSTKPEGRIIIGDVTR